MNGASTRLTVAVGLSGGIDSAVAAFCLLRQGHAVIGLTMQTWDGSVPLADEGLSGCFGPGEARDLESARRHAERLGIRHVVVPLAREYAAEVLGYFRAEYLAGRTPNPCVRCNRVMKFGLLLERARSLGLAFDRFATGHYARVDRDAATGRWRLRKGLDAAKDQSYFLARLTQDQLARVVFPLGDLNKREVRAIARDQGWTELLERPESQDFVECSHYATLLGPDAERPGPIVDPEGREIGRHRGVAHYTVGQRKGLGLSGTAEPLYVWRVDAAARTVTVGPQSGLFTRRLRAADANWIALAGPPDKPRRANVRIRQQHHEAAATLSAAAGDPAALEAVFDEPQLSVTPGQTAVFYDGDTVLGSAIIDPFNPA